MFGIYKFEDSLSLLTLLLITLKIFGLIGATFLLMTSSKHF